MSCGQRPLSLKEAPRNFLFLKTLGIFLIKMNLFIVLKLLKTTHLSYLQIPSVPLWPAVLGQHCLAEWRFPGHRVGARFPGTLPVSILLSLSYFWENCGYVMPFTWSSGTGKMKLCPRNEKSGLGRYQRGEGASQRSGVRGCSTSSSGQWLNRCIRVYTALIFDLCLLYVGFTLRN